jgi:hypothetical protein
MMKKHSSSCISLLSEREKEIIELIARHLDVYIYCFAPRYR